MTLKDAMNEEASRLFTSGDEFAEAVTFYPSAGATGFAVYLVPEDLAEQFATISTGPVDTRRMQAFGALDDLVDGITAIETTARKPRRGDLVRFEAASAYAGDWLVESVSVDLGNGCTMHLRHETKQAAGRDTVEVR